MSLRMGKDLGMPIESVTEKTAFIGRTGQGKTYAALKLAEEIDRNNGQFVALDPVGVWWSLRLAADGKRRGIQIPVFGGLNGDIPLESTAGRLMADVIADRGISVVLDVSQFDSDAAKNRFARDFGDRFFFRKKAAPSAVHIFLEEAQEFVPQNLMGDGDRELLHVFTRMWKLGRNYGIGGSLITQRPQEVNKKVLNLTEVLFAFQLNGKHERKAVADWIEDKGLDIDVQQLLPRLKRGQPHVWSPVLLEMSRTVKIGRRWTYDASSTPKVGSRPVVKTLAPIDLAKLQKDMAATIEKAKTTDPRLLQQRVRELELQIAKKLPVQKIVGEKIKRVEVPMINSRTQARLDMLSERMAKSNQLAEKLIGEIAALDVRAKPDPTPDVKVSLRKYDHLFTTPANAEKQAERILKNARGSMANSVGTGRPESNGKLQQGERALLTAIVQHNSVTRSQLSILTGYRATSIKTYLGFLSQKGYINNQKDDIRPTIEGQATLGPYEPLPTGQALAAYWQRELSGGEQSIFTEVHKAGPNGLSRAQIAEKTGYKDTSIKTYVGFLSARKLVSNQRGLVVASNELYD